MHSCRSSIWFSWNHSSFFTDDKGEINSLTPGRAETFTNISIKWKLIWWSNWRRGGNQLLIYFNCLLAIISAGFIVLQNLIVEMSFKTSSPCDWRYCLNCYCSPSSMLIAFFQQQSLQSGLHLVSPVSRFSWYRSCSQLRWWILHSDKQPVQPANSALGH